MQARRPRRVTVEEYLALDEAAPEGVKLELFDGVLYCNGHVVDPDHVVEAVGMAGGSREHNQICVNVTTQLNLQLPESCAVMLSDQQTRFDLQHHYGYPDAVATCDAPEMKGVILLNPQLVVEVFSPSTSQHDLTTKKLAYQQWPSVLEIWFLAQDRPLVMQHTRLVLEGRERWVETSYVSLDATLTSERFGLEVPVGEFYRRVPGVLGATKSEGQN